MLHNHSRVVDAVEGKQPLGAFNLKMCSLVFTKSSYETVENGETGLLQLRLDALISHVSSCQFIDHEGFGSLAEALENIAIPGKSQT